MATLLGTARAGEREGESADLSLEGMTTYEGFGEAITMGDFDRDGNADLAVGQPPAPGYHDAEGEGDVWVWRGPISGTGLEPADAYAVIEGSSSGYAWGGGTFGSVLYGGGDYDGDGINDLAVGEPGKEGGTTTVDEGAVWVYYGGDVLGTSGGTLHRYNDASTYDYGDDAYYELGTSITAADVDGDSIDDLVVGQVAFGSGGSIVVHYSLNTPSYGEFFTRAGSNGEQAGAALASGNFLNTGPAVAIGAPYRDTVSMQDGVVYLIDGDELLADDEAFSAYTLSVRISGDGSVLHVGRALAALPNYGSGTDVYEDLLVCGNYACAWFEDFSSSVDWGDATATFVTDAREPTVANVGDVDGDGTADFVIGAPDADWDGSGSAEGAAFLFLSSDLPAGATDLSDAAMVFPGRTAGAAMGFAVAGGDVNADGKSDIFLAAPDDDLGYTVETGGAYLYYAPFDPIAGEIPLWDASAKVVGDDFEDWFGFAVSSIGDVNCDGIDDLAMGGVRADDTTSTTGAVFIFLGPVAGGSSLYWMDPYETALYASDADIVFYGATVNEGAGNQVRGLGNFDDDAGGCDDFAVAASAGDLGGTDSGTVYVFSGSTALGDTISELEAADAMVIFHGTAMYDRFGMGIDGGGDFDGDGTPDLVVGAPGYDLSATVPDSGAVCVFLGGSAWSGTVSAASASCTYREYQPNALTGWSVLTGFDFNGDGTSDLAVGSPLHDDTGKPNNGMVYVDYGGGCAGTVNIGTADARFKGAQAGHLLGSTLASGNITPDGGPGAACAGCDDLVVGAPGGSLAGSYAYWIPGRTGFTGTDTVPSGGVTFGGTAGSFGWSVASGEVDPGDDGDGDGMDEVIIGDPYYGGGVTDQGATFLWRSEDIAAWANDGLVHSLTTAAVTMTGDVYESYAGWSVSTLGDLNQDGEEDIGIGAWGYSSDRGAAFVVLSSY